MVTNFETIFSQMDQQGKYGKEQHADNTVGTMKIEGIENYVENNATKRENKPEINTKIEIMDPEQLYYMDEYNDAYFGNENQEEYEQSNTYHNFQSSQIPSYERINRFQSQNSNLQSQCNSNEVQFQGFDPIKKKKVKILRKPTRINMDRNAYQIMLQMFKIYDKKQEELKFITFSKISEAIGYNHAVIANYYEEYRNRLDGGHKRNYKPMIRHVPIDNSIYGSTNIRLQRLAVLEEIIIKNPYLTRKELRDQINKYDHLKPLNKQVSTTMVSQVLNEAGYRQKRCFISAFDRNTEQILQQRKKYCERIDYLRQNNKRIYFFDYNQFNIYSIRQKMWYNKKIYARQFEVSDYLAGDQNLVMLALMNEQGIAQWEIQYKSAITKSVVGYFEILAKKIKLSQDQNIVNYIFFDHEKFPEKVLQSLKDNNIELKVYNTVFELLPTKSSVMNPIQSWFHIIKNQICNKNFNKNSQLKCEFLKHMTRTQKQQMKDNLLKTEAYMEKCLKKQPF